MMHRKKKTSVDVGYTRNIENSPRIVCFCGHCRVEIKPFEGPPGGKSTRISSPKKLMYKVPVPLKINGEDIPGYEMIVGIEYPVRMFLDGELYRCAGCGTRHSTVQFTKIANMVYVTFI
jgi:hypothetical protein